MSEDKKKLLQAIGAVELFLQKNAGQLIAELHKLLQYGILVGGDFLREKVEESPNTEIPNRN